jgi:hypothetical protein
VWESEGQKERVLSAILHSLELDLSRLWKLDVPEEEFMNLYSKVFLSKKKNSNLFYLRFVILC